MGIGGNDLLLLDLDGVVVLECGPPLVERTEILRLHQGLGQTLAELDMPVVVLTHRSRREALHILEAAGVSRADLAGLKAAEDLFRAGMAPKALPVMMKRGLRKDLILPVLAREFGVSPANIAFIDDVASNLDDLLGGGIGLAMHAPSVLQADDGGFVSFRFDEALSVLADWRGSGRVGQRTRLSEAPVRPEPWRSTGLCTTAQADHAFNRLRAAASKWRQGRTAKAPATPGS